MRKENKKPIIINNTIIITKQDITKEIAINQIVKDHALSIAKDRFHILLKIVIRRSQYLRHKKNSSNHEKPVAKVIIVTKSRLFSNENEWVRQ